MNASRWKMEAYRILFVVIVAISSANAQGVLVNPYSNPASGNVFSYDLNQPGPTMTCIGSNNDTGPVAQQNTGWKVLYSTGPQDIASSSIFALSQENGSLGGIGQSNLTILNVTNILDGATISCGIIISAKFTQIASFTVKIYWVPVLKTVGTVNGLKDSSVTLQIGDALFPPPYPTPNFTIAGNGTLILAQIQYNHPNLTLSGLTEANSGSYVLTATNSRFNGIFLGASNGTFTLNVQFAPVITAGRSQAAAVQGQPFPVPLQCGTNLRGNPFPTVQWKSSNGTVVTSGGRYAMDNGPSNVQLNISNVDRNSNGTWMCILSNGILSPIVVNIFLYVLVPPSPPLNVTDGMIFLTNPKSQVSVSWQVPFIFGVPPLSEYRVFAVSARDPTNQTTSSPANQTFATIGMLLAGLNYTITVYAVSIVGTTEAVSNPSDMVTLNTAPDVPTVVCSPLTASLGNVNVSWVISHDGGRPVTAIQIGYRQVGTGGNLYQYTQAVVSPGATSAIIMQQFVATSSYAFQVNVTNEIGNSTSVCGQVTISEGIPPTPKTYTFTYGPNSVVLMISAASSGAGTTDSFAFRVVSSDPYVNQSFPFPSYAGGTKVTVTVTGLRDGTTYFFSVYASNVYGTSDPANVMVPPISTSPPTSGTLPSNSAPQNGSAGAIAGGVLGGIIGLLLLAIVIVVVVLLLRHRGATYNIENKGVKVEEIDVDLGEDMPQPMEKTELHYAELGSFNVKPPAPKSSAPQVKVDEDPVTYSTVQLTHTTPVKEVNPDATTKTDTSTTMV